MSVLYLWLASQEGGFKKPELPRAKKPKLQSKAMLEQEVERLKEQNKQEREQSNQRLTSHLTGVEIRQYYEIPCILRSTVRGVDYACFYK